jgi:hypothetical protein
MRNVQKLKIPSQVVLDGSALDETILVSMNNLKNHNLKSVSQKLSLELQGVVQQRDGSKIINSLRTALLGD